MCHGTLVVAECTNSMYHLTVPSGETFFQRHKGTLMIGVVLVGIHVTWWNLQGSHVPLEERTEVKAFRAIQNKFFNKSDK